MAGISNLQTLLKSMTPELVDGGFVFLTLSDEVVDDLTVEPRLIFREREGVTVILDEDEAKQFGFDYEYVWAMITLNVHSDLDSVGFCAAILPELADAGISVNVVAGYYHDHFFVPIDRAEEAVGILKKISD